MSPATFAMWPWREGLASFLGVGRDNHMGACGHMGQGFARVTLRGPVISAAAAA